MVTPRGGPLIFRLYLSMEISIKRAMRTVKARAFVSSAAVCIALSGVASATTVGIDAIPTGWRLQNYVGSGIALWGAPAPECVITANNTTKLDMPSTTASDDKNQFGAIMLSAIITEHKIHIEYDNTTCAITSFAMDGT